MRVNGDIEAGTLWKSKDGGIKKKMMGRGKEMEGELWDGGNRGER